MTPRLRLLAAAVGGVLGTVAALAKKMRRSGRRQCQTGDHIRPRRVVPSAAGQDMTPMVKSIRNGSRFEEIWLDR
jgi:hypothetical protein